MEQYMGAIIEESLEDKAVLSDVHIVKTEAEDHSGETWNIHWIKIDVTKLNTVIEKLMTHMKDGWYAHFWLNDHMIVIFRGRKFDMRKDDFGGIETRLWMELEYQGRVIEMTAYAGTPLEELALLALEQPWPDPLPTEMQRRYEIEAHREGDPGTWVVDDVTELPLPGWSTMRS